MLPNYQARSPFVLKHTTSINKSFNHRFPQIHFRTSYSARFVSNTWAFPIPVNSFINARSKHYAHPGSSLTTPDLDILNNPLDRLDIRIWRSNLKEILIFHFQTKNGNFNRE